MERCTLCGGAGADASLSGCAHATHEACVTFLEEQLAQMHLLLRCVVCGSAHVGAAAASEMAREVRTLLERECGIVNSLHRRLRCGEVLADLVLHCPANGAEYRLRVTRASSVGRAKLHLAAVGEGDTVVAAVAANLWAPAVARAVLDVSVRRLMQLCPLVPPDSPWAATH